MSKILIKIPVAESDTCEVFYDGRRYLFGFDKMDGHLAFVFDKVEREYIYMCEHTKKGLEKLGIDVELFKTLVKAGFKIK